MMHEQMAKVRTGKESGKQSVDTINDKENYGMT